MSLSIVDSAMLCGWVRLASFLGLGALVLIPRAGHAEDLVAVAPDRRVVQVVVAASDEESAAIEASLHELLGRLNLDLEVAHADRLDLDTLNLTPPASSHALAMVWLDMRNPARAIAVMVDVRTGKIVARREVARGSSSPVLVEEVAHVVHASVEELAIADRNRPPDPSAEKPAESVAPPKQGEVPAVKGPKWGLDGGAFVNARGFGDDAPFVLGGGAAIRFDLAREGWRPGVWITGAYHVPFEVPGTLVNAHVKVLSLRLAPTLKLFGGSSWVVEAGPELGIDVAISTPRSDSLPDRHIHGDTSEVSPLIGAIIVGRMAIGNTTDLFLAGAVDIDLEPDRYVTRIGNEYQTVFAPARVRPAILMGFTFTFAGSAAHPTRVARP